MYSFLSIRNKVFQLMSATYARVFFGAGEGTFISVKSQLIGKKITIGKNCRILRHVKLDTSNNPSSPDFKKNFLTGSIFLGDEVIIKDYSQLYSYDSFIRIGNNSTINPFCIIYGHGGVTIGKNVLIAASTIIVSSNHIFDSIELPISRQGITAEGVVIGDDVWIGSNVKILDGVCIGHGSVVASGSVVTKSLDSFGIYGGVPAKLIRKRKMDF